MAQSNINLMYEQIVRDLAERAKLIKNDSPNMPLWEVIERAVDEGLIATCDNAYIVARAYLDGLFSWGEPICWDCVLETLYNDITREYNAIMGSD